MTVAAIPPGDNVKTDFDPVRGRRLEPRPVCADFGFHPRVVSSAVGGLNHRQLASNPLGSTFSFSGIPLGGMNGFCENMRFGSHADRAFCGKRGLVGPAKKPRLAATAVANTLTVATHAFFIRGGELEKVMRHSLEDAERPIQVHHGE